MSITSYRAYINLKKTIKLCFNTKLLPFMHVSAIIYLSHKHKIYILVLTSSLRPCCTHKLSFGHNMKPDWLIENI